LQVEVTARQRNELGLSILGSLDVKLRAQICPSGANMGASSCGQLVDSGASVSIPPNYLLFPPAATLLPIWQLRMWSENIKLHLEIVDAIDGVVYNCLVPYYDNAGWRADDFYVPIEVGTVAPPGGNVSVTVHVQDSVSKAPIQGASVSIN
jgi:hypothetical protein